MASKRYREALVFAGLFALAAGLRLFQVDRQILLDDEWHAIMKLATAGYGAIATSFGVVDHSIPLTLLFKWIADQGRLSEFTMLALPLVAGMASWLLLVAAARKALSPAALAAFAGLLAVSPLMVLYARQARPYAMTLLLTLVAMWAAWKWAGERRAIHGAGYVLASVLAVWMHVIVAPAVFGVWIYLFLDAVIRDRKDWRAAAWTVAPGIAALALAAALLAPAVLGDWGGLRVKAGASRVTLESAARSLMMWFGTGSTALAAAMAALALAGTVSCFRRMPRIALYVSTTLLVQAAAVALSGAAWIDQPMVLARYLLVFLPFVLLAAAAGFGACCERLLPAAGGTVPTVAALALAGAAFALGPLPGALRFPSAFFSHHAHFADFDEAHNPMLPYLRAGPVPAFYRELASLGPGEVTLVEAPWRFESMFNRQPLFQAVHRQHVKIGFVGAVCPPGAYAEHPRFFANRFRNFVDLGWQDGKVRASGDYLVVHRALELGNMTEPWQTYGGKGLPPVEPCLGDFRRRFGEPVFEDGLITVFALRERAATRGGRGGSRG